MEVGLCPDPGSWLLSIIRRSRRCCMRLDSHGSENIPSSPKGRIESVFFEGWSNSRD